MGNTATQKVWTEEELMALPQDGYKRELVNGDIVMSPAGMEHGWIAVRLVAALEVHVEPRRLGVVFDSSTGFWMESGNARSPDVSFIARERLRGLKRVQKRFFKGAPDLVVEILSPSDTTEKTHEKLVEYFANGARLGWVVNPEERTVLVYHSAEPDKRLRMGDSLDGENVVPDFSFPLAKLFADVDFD